MTSEASVRENGEDVAIKTDVLRSS
jgi:hypothetical protein